MELVELILEEGNVVSARALGLILGWGLGGVACEFFSEHFDGLIGDLRTLSGGVEGEYRDGSEY